MVVIKTKYGSRSTLRGEGRTAAGWGLKLASHTHTHSAGVSKRKQAKTYRT